MIRTVLATPWGPIVYWVFSLIVVQRITNSISLKNKISQKPDISIDRPLVRDVSGNPIQNFKYLPEWMYLDVVVTPPKHNIDTKWDSSGFHRSFDRIASQLPDILAPTSTLAIRSYPGMPADNVDGNTLEIRCRTYAAVSNLEGNRVTVHGVVTEDVVSATGKILIMAGSKVVGSALIDPENRRLKSDFNYWSIFVDETEIKVQARLLEKVGGLSGIQGKQISAERLDQQRCTRTSDKHYILFPEASPFCLEVKGDISLRDVKAEQRTQGSIF